MHAARRQTGTAALLLALMASTGVASRAAAQQVDSTRAGVTSRRRPRAVVVDTAPKPPISPARAFLSSFLVPGLGQARLNRPNAGALFASVEMLGLAMVRKSTMDLREARRFAKDSVPLTYATDPATGAVQLDTLGRPVIAARTANGLGDRVRARRVHLEDWMALLVFNHLISGADSFVAANLWDLPAEVSTHASARQLDLSLSFAW